MKSQLTLLYFILYSLYSWSQVDSSSKEENYNNFDDLVLNGLKKYEITVASKNKETIAEAPGIISVFDQKEIQDLGYFTIRDLANITPGYSSFRSLGEITLETRGQKTSGFDNNKHLLLYDGIPIYHARAGKVMVEEEFPLFFGHQVEFLRGPGTSLYGVGAFYGVINVNSVPSKSDQVQVNSLMGLSSRDMAKKAFVGVMVPHKNGYSSFNFGIYGKRASLELLGSSSSYNPNALNQDNVSSLFMNTQHTFDKGKFRGVSFGFVHLKKRGGLGDYWSGYQANTHRMAEITWSTYIPYVKYTKNIGVGWRLNSYIKSNLSTEKGTTGNGIFLADSTLMSLYNIDVLDKEVSVELSYNNKNKKQQNLYSSILGINYNVRYQLGEPHTYAHFINANQPGLIYQDTLTYSNPAETYRTLSAYLQHQHKLTKWVPGLSFTTGVRYDGIQIFNKIIDKRVDYFEQYSPRIGVVQQLFDKLSIKALLGKAIRAPYLKMRGLNLESISKHPEKSDVIPLSLQPAQINSKELSITAEWNTFSFTTTFFHNVTKNDLIKISIDTIGQVFSNSDDMITSQGVETELRYRHHRYHLDWQLNWSYANSYLDNKIPIYDVPVHKINHIVKYYVQDKITVTMINQFVSEFRNKKKNSTGYFITDLNVNYQIGKNYICSLQLRNVFNEKYYYPLFDGSGNLQVLGQKRTFNINLQFML